MQEMKPLLDLLEGHFGWLPTVITWLFAIQTAMKLINAKLQAALTTRMVGIADSPTLDDDTYFDDILQARWYRIAAFVLDLIFRLKLPTHADFTKLLAAKQTP